MWFKPNQAVKIVPACKTVSSALYMFGNPALKIVDDASVKRSVRSIGQDLGKIAVVPHGRRMGRSG